MTRLAVQMATTPAATAFAAPVSFDFSNSIDPGSGERIVGYAVALSGFVAGYETSGRAWAENLAQFSVSLIPSLVNTTTLQVTGNLVLTDYDGDAALAPGLDDAAGCLLQITAIAVLGTQPPGTSLIVGNYYGLPDGQPSPQPIVVGTNTQNFAFLSGFNFTASNPGKISGLQLSGSVNPPSPHSQAVTLTCTSQVQGLQGSSGSADLCFISASSDITNFQIVPATIVATSGGNGDWDGYHLVLQNPFSQKVLSAALLLGNLAIAYDGSANFEQINAYLSAAPDITSNDDGSSTVTMEVDLNIFNPDLARHHYIDGAHSLLQAYMLVQFS